MRPLKELTRVGALTSFELSVKILPGFRNGGRNLLKQDAVSLCVFALRMITP